VELTEGFRSLYLKSELAQRDLLVRDCSMSVANYAAGTLGIFEYMRFDRAKPGVLKKLGPFVDDVVGG
jgi:phosphatidylglycerophosphatase A